MKDIDLIIYLIVQEDLEKFMKEIDLNIVPIEIEKFMDEIYLIIYLIVQEDLEKFMEEIDLIMADVQVRFFTFNFLKSFIEKKYYLIIKINVNQKLNIP